MNAYIVTFKGNRKNCFLDPGDLNITIGSYVVVQAERGEDYGKVERKAKETEVSPEGEPLKVLRLGTDYDTERLNFNRQKEEETFGECVNFIAKHNLKM